MSLRVVCVHCGYRYVLNERYAGATVRCRTCGQEFLVPNPGEQGPAPSAPHAQDVESRPSLQAPGGTAAPSKPSAGEEAIGGWYRCDRRVWGGPAQGCR